jgi:hypothetical protein
MFRQYVNLIENDKTTKRMKGMFIGKEVSIFGKDERYSIDLKKMISMEKHIKGWWNLLFSIENTK